MVLFQFYFTKKYCKVHISIYSYSKNCGTSNIEINQLADTEHEQMNEGSDTESEMPLFAAQNENIDSTVRTASVSNFCLFVFAKNSFVFLIYKSVYLFIF